VRESRPNPGAKPSDWKVAIRCLPRCQNRVHGGRDYRLSPQGLRLCTRGREDVAHSTRGV